MQRGVTWSVRAEMAARKLRGSSTLCGRLDFFKSTGTETDTRSQLKPDEKAGTICSTLIHDALA